MNHHYNDIRRLIPQEPTWWDEHAVPRYCAFSPDEAAAIHADEIVLLCIACQNCEREFHVCLSWSRMDKMMRGDAALSTLIEARKIHYGDPPNVDCCPAGPTMNSIPQRVVEFWRRAPFNVDGPDWIRDPALEIDVLPDWAKDDQ